jgi:hypothetical protein
MDKTTSFERNKRLARKLWTGLSSTAIQVLKELTKDHGLSVASGDLLLLAGRWYITHTGLLALARRNRCAGIHVQPLTKFCDPSARRWAFRATVYKTRNCRGFVGCGDADPLNVTSLVHGAEMRVAETRAVNRALRKAFGIGICSVEELGSLAQSTQTFHEVKKLSPQAVNRNNGNYGGPKVRDRLCQLMRQHQLDPNLVKSYAVDFCGTKTLREASRQQVEGFVTHLADWAVKDRNALLCQLNSYLGSKEDVA